MALATIDDLEARGVDTCDTGRAVAFLDGASAMVVDYTGQTFERSERVVEVWPTNGYFDLRGRMISGMEAVDVDDNAVTLTQRAKYRWYAGTDRKLTVTYTEGWSTPPQTIVEVVCNIVARAMSVDSSQLGHSQDTAGPFSFTVGSAAASGVLGLLPAEKAALDVYRPKVRAIHGASWAASP